MTVVHRLGDDEAVGLAGALESGSTHPIARAVTAYAETHGTTVAVASPPARDESAPLEGVGGEERPPLGLVTDADTPAAVRGDGVVGRVSGHDVRVGRPEWIGVDEPWWSQADSWRRDGLTTIAVCVDGEVRALLAVGDEVRATTHHAVARLRELGLEPVMVTGDAEPVARAVAAAVGIDRVIADARPEDKVAEVVRLHESGRVVAVVGDGINDAAALAAADLGIAMGGGTDVAIEAADITLLRDDLRTAGDAVRLSRATLRTIKQNLGWAFGYNIAAIPLAAAGLLTPMIAGLAMAMSSVCVVANSLRLRRFH
jgi:Cu+-exporting ATPase